jgi:uncharacterized membrane-anchored protein
MLQSILHVLRQTTTKVIIVIIQVLLLAALAFSHFATSWYGQEIKLQTVPVDPRDILYGDYATLQYEISNLPISLWKDENKPADLAAPVDNSMIYVVLVPTGDADETYVADGFYTTKPQVTDEQIVLKAKVEYNNGLWNDNKETSIRVRYGLEKYYVPENTGKKLEEQSREGVLIAIVKVSKWSGPVIEDLQVAKVTP